MPLSRANKYFNRIFNKGHSGAPCKPQKLFKLSQLCKAATAIITFDAIVLIDFITWHTIRK